MQSSALRSLRQACPRTQSSHKPKLQFSEPVLQLICPCCIAGSALIDGENLYIAICSRALPLPVMRSNHNRSLVTIRQCQLAIGAFLDNFVARTRATSPGRKARAQKSRLPCLGDRLPHNGPSHHFGNFSPQFEGLCSIHLILVTGTRVDGRSQHHGIGMLAAFRWCCLLTLLFGTLVAGVKPKVAGKARTYITNDSSQTIVAVVSFAYFPEPVPVPVKNRVLPPGAHGQSLAHALLVPGQKQFTAGRYRRS